MTNFGPVNTLAVNTAGRSQIEDAYDIFALDSKRESVFFLELPIRRKGDVDTLNPGTAPINTLPVNVTRNSADFLPTTEILFFSSRNWVGRPDDPLKRNTAPHRRLSNAFRLTRRTPFSNEASRRIQFSVSTTTLDNKDRAFDFLIDDSIATGFKATFYHGDRNFQFNQMRRIAQPKTTSIEGGEEISIQFSNDASSLIEPLQSIKFAGTGGLEGTPDMAGELKPFFYGEPYHMEATLTDPSLNLYVVSSEPVNGFITVWDGGIELTYDRDYPTLEALAAATIAPGTYATCNAFAAFRLGAAPVSVVCCTPRSTILSSREAALDALSKRAGRPLSDLNIPSFSNLSASKIGWYNERQEITVETFLTRILSVENGFLYDDSFGRLAIGRHLAPENVSTPARTIRLRKEQIVGAKVDFSFVSTQNCGYGKVWRTLSENEFNGAVPESVRQRLRIQFLFIDPRVSGVTQALRENSVTATKNTFWTEDEEQAAVDQADNDISLFGRERVAYKLEDIGKEGIIMEDGEPFVLVAPVFGFENGKTVIPLQFDQTANRQDGDERVDLEIVA